jgi:hypothetical protein
MSDECLNNNNNPNKNNTYNIVKDDNVKDDNVKDDTVKDDNVKNDSVKIDEMQIQDPLTTLLSSLMSSFMNPQAKNADVKITDIIDKIKKESENTQIF